MDFDSIEVYCNPCVMKVPTGSYVVGCTPWVEYTEENFQKIKKIWDDKMDAFNKKNASKNSFKIEVITSNSDPTKAYKVKVFEDGRFECDCKGFLYRKSCSHVDKIKEKKCLEK